MFGYNAGIGCVLGIIPPSVIDAWGPDESGPTAEFVTEVLGILVVSAKAILSLTSAMREVPVPKQSFAKLEKDRWHQRISDNGWMHTRVVPSMNIGLLMTAACSKEVVPIFF